MQPISKERLRAVAEVVVNEILNEKDADEISLQDATEMLGSIIGGFFESLIDGEIPIHREIPDGVEINAETIAQYTVKPTDADYIPILKKEIASLLELAKNWIEFRKEVVPYVEIELTKLRKQYPELKIDTKGALLIINEYIMQRIDESEIEMLAEQFGDRFGCPFIKLYVSLCNAVKECRENHKESAAFSVGAKVPESYLYPIEKGITALFNKMEIGTEALKAEPNGSKKEVTNYITLDIDELPENDSVRAIFSGLGEFDKRIYSAVDSLLQAGNEYISASQVWRSMGNTKSPSQDQIKRILLSCEKMSKCRVSYDNSEEIAAGYNYDVISIKRVYLFPVEFTADIAINGKIVKNCLHILKPSLPLMDIVRSKGQFVSYTHEQLTLPDGMNMTDDTLQLDGYLRRRIGRKSKEQTLKIVRQTIYDNCNIPKSSRKKKARCDEKIRKLFSHYKKVGIIAGYTEHNDYFIINRVKN